MKVFKSQYILQTAEKTTCPGCHKYMELLCREDVKPHSPMFYICWNCKRVFHAGHGEVMWEFSKSVKRG